ncbi:NUDIX domain-containing protein [Pseudovibrio sp. Tun.PSC04-5.I4]|uniref:NUDIX hydrolase n=1 Tax=Pseudovibrio sp. Tun.PSC04-5.I4 TaxID=1798213 RepID=UPI0008803AE1|nr:NUDIX domain-containing protein [Pseudovibrio sp. Tun.PSC04-5.I4]SDR23539.1 NUDIX domain-containing protein [Pseudovibrio sp. Tun.PSC04-5.I4]
MKKRPAARLLVLDPKNRVLLFNFKFDTGPLAGRDYWASVGGGLETGETYEEAARRELLEETGIADPIGQRILTRTVTFQMPSGEMVEAEEHYFLVSISHSNIDYSRHTELETQVMRNYRWWTLAELRSTTQTVYPENILEVLEPYLKSQL